MKGKDPVNQTKATHDIEHNIRFGFFEQAHGNIIYAYAKAP